MPDSDLDREADDGDGADHAEAGPNALTPSQSAPDSDLDREADDGDGTDHGEAGPNALLPPKSEQSPSVEARFQFNQFNMEQIPQTLYDRLSPDQLVRLIDTWIEHADRMDERRLQVSYDNAKKNFEYAIEKSKRDSEVALDKAKRDERKHKRGTYIGGLVSICGFSTVLLLAQDGNDVVAGIIATFLATVISFVVGSKTLD